MKFLAVQILLKHMYQKKKPSLIILLFVYFFVLFTFIECEGARDPAWMLGGK